MLWFWTDESDLCTLQEHHDQLLTILPTVQIALEVTSVYSTSKSISLIFHLETH
jgi:hypothetical protein